MISARTKTCLLWSALAFVVLPSAQAVEITFRASGVVSGVSDSPDVPYFSSVHSGDPFALTYTFESSTPNALTPPEYRYENVLRSVTLDIGAEHLDLSTGAGTDGAMIYGQNDYWSAFPMPSYADTYVVAFTRHDGSLVSSLGLTLILLTGSPSSALSSTELSSVPPDPLQFMQHDMWVSFMIPDPNGPMPGMGPADTLSADISSIARVSSVPLPATGLLIGPALGMLARWRTRKA